MGRPWGEGIDLPTYEMRRALHVLYGFYGGSMNHLLGDVYISSTTGRGFRDLQSVGLVRRRWLTGWEITPAGVEKLREAGIA